MHFNVTPYEHMEFQDVLFPTQCPVKILYAFLFSPVRPTCPTLHRLSDLTTLIIFSERYKSRGSSLCNFLQLPVTAYPAGPSVSSASCYAQGLKIEQFYLNNLKILPTVKTYYFHLNIFDIDVIFHID
jgi:hypothetical protein